MRSDLVAQAAEPVSNRFLLMHVTTAITRKFHRPTRDRLPETINSVLANLGEGKYLLKHFVRPDSSTFGVEAYCSDSTGQLKPEDALTALTTLTTGLPYFPDEDEPTPEERMAVCSALIGAPAIAETA